MSTRTHFPGFPALYDPPADTLRLLREVDPAVDLVYFGWGRWYLARLRPNREHILKAARRLPETLRLLRKWEVTPAYRANPAAFKRLYGRHLFWRLVAEGGRPIAEYDRWFIRTLGFAAIVDDFRCMEWLYQRATDAEMELQLNPEEEPDEDLSDPYTHQEAARYLFTRTHSVTRHDDPERRRHRSGFKTVAATGPGRRLV